MAKRKFYETVIMATPPKPHPTTTFKGIIVATSKKQASKYAMEALQLKMTQTSDKVAIEVTHNLISIKLTAYDFVSDMEMAKTMLKQIVGQNKKNEKKY